MLCNDLVWSVLLHLPTKSLMRFKCVSKVWYWIIRNPNFAKGHSQGSGSFQGLLITDFLARYPNLYHSRLNRVFLCNLDSENCNKRKKLFYYHHYDWDLSRFEGVTNIVKGLIGLYKNDSFTLCNVSTKEMVELPRNYVIGYYSYHLGYDPHRDVFKVLIVYGQTVCSTTFSTKLFTVGSGSDLEWRSVGPAPFDSDGQSCSINGVQYWLPSRYNDHTQLWRKASTNEVALVGFNLTTEKFATFALPDIRVGSAILVEIDRRPALICLFAGNLYNMRLWTMEIDDVGVLKGWTVQEFVLPMYQLHFAGTLPNGEMLVAQCNAESPILICKYNYLKKKMSVIKLGPPQSQLDRIDTGEIQFYYHEENIMALAPLLGSNAENVFTGSSIAAINTNSLGIDIQADSSNDPEKNTDKLQKRGGKAAASLFNWEVLENISRNFGVSKSHFLQKEAEDLAVHIALGETQVIAETKKALAKAGVNITSLEKFATHKSSNLKRSNHVILVTNLPYGSSENELAAIFGRFGSLDKLILPPTKTLALIIFLEPSEARAAFNSLCYTRYKDVPLYLEWAPNDILADDETTNETIVGKDEVNRVQLEQEVEGLVDPDIDHDRIESRSLYVKNLNFKTSDESLRKHFSELVKGGQILSVRVKKHLETGKNVAMGFGFIEFDSVETAVNICRDLQGTVLDGHALILQLCHAKEGQTAKKVENDKSSTKLIIRNVAFEATEKELRQVLSSYGQIKRLKLPMRLGNHRGFAFVEYVTKQEAQNAIQGLASTHFYDRHLVIELAKEGESLEELRD